MIIYGISLQKILYFLIINSIIKVIPFYYLWNQPILIKDIYFTLGLFILLHRPKRKMRQTFYKK
jgi:hypothetical protein